MGEAYEFHILHVMFDHSECGPSYIMINILRAISLKKNLAVLH